MATTENTLRTRQNMEILDVWKNLSSQVNALTKRQVAVFPDTLKPKTQRDMEVEVNVDKTIEGLNASLETRLANLEFVLKNDAQLRQLVRRMEIEGEEKKGDEPPIPDYIDTTNLGKAERERANASNQLRERLREERAKRDIIKAEGKLLPFQNAYQDIINTGSVVSQWNNIVRYYQKQGLSRQSQEMVKVKVQDLVPNLEALVYGFGEAVDKLFSIPNFNSSVGLKILQLLRSKSVYQLIKTQAETSAFELLSVPLLETTFKNIFAELSQQRRELLDEISARGNITENPIRLIPKTSSGNFTERLNALADELGINVRAIPASLLTRLKAMNQADFEKSAFEMLAEIEKRKGVRDANIAKTLADIQKLEVEKAQLEQENDVEIPTAIRMYEENIEVLGLDEKHDADDLGDDEDLEPVPPLGEEPQVSAFSEMELDGGETFDESAFNRAKSEWDEKVRERDEVLARNLQRENDNRLREELRQKDKATRIADYRRKIDELVATADRNTLRIKEIETTLLPKLTDSLKILTLRSMTNPQAFLTKTLKAIKDIASVYKTQETKGRGKPVDFRGLAGYGNHYGAEDDSSEEDDSESESESDEEDPLAFDDRRNDSYYSRPARRR